ncbi:hypothetical protein V1517DRAFT_326107 [Lipomyces orientalis]|uniref:Uncharacterized protein n=1 Tax=Lipomyces orientalis TaxID=1233043 RepID=A0ACC3TJY8_9ASCO
MLGRNFKLEDGVQFDYHANALIDVESDNQDVEYQSFYRVKGNTKTLCTTVEYEPPHKLSVEACAIIIIIPCRTNISGSSSISLL